MKKILLCLLLVIPFNVYGFSYVVMDSDTLRVLEGENIYKTDLIASTTKILTTMVVLNNMDINKEITVGEEVLKSTGSGIYISLGEKITIYNLLLGLMLRSGNDAALTLAVNTSGSIEGFSILMNELATSIGMKNSKFYNPHGLEDEYGENKSTVYDMALLSSYAIKNELYKKIVSTKKVAVKTNLKTYVWHNKNKLLTTYKHTIGGKTGYTKKAKRTLVTNASKDNVNLTIVTFRDSDDFNRHQSLYEKYFKILNNYKIIEKGNINTKYDNTYIKESFNMSLTKEEYERIDISINYIDKSNQNVIGILSVKLDGIEYFKTDIYLKEKRIKNKTWWEKLLSIFSYFLAY